MDYQKFYLSPQGRVNRKQLWLYLVLPAVVVSIILSIIDASIGTVDPESGLGLLSGLCSLIVLIPAIIVYIKRFHDRDKSGWWVLIAFTIIGIFLLIYWACVRGTAGPNRFGADPLGGTGVTHQ